MPESPTARLLVVRHGRTSRTKERALGRGVAALDDVGVAQARTVASAVCDERWDRLWCSPSQAAVATAQPLAAQLGVLPQVREQLGELDAPCQGHADGDPWGRTGPRVPAPAGLDGESVQAAWRRVSDFRQQVGAELEDGGSIVVGHYAVNQLLVAQLLGLPLDGALHSAAYRPSPGSALELVLTAGRWRWQGFRVTAVAVPA